MSDKHSIYSSSFEAQVHQFTTGLVNAISALAPLFLILVILGIAVANAYVEYLYQEKIFGDYATAPAILVAGLRFSSGMGGVTLLKWKKYMPGIMFVFVSLLLTIYTWWHVDDIAMSIAPQNAVSANFTISMILWGGFIGELMIAAYMGATKGNDTPEEDQEAELV